jgi:ATP-binding cassette subfamily C (CFTR/MRP) protein 1
MKRLVISYTVLLNCILVLISRVLINTGFAVLATIVIISIQTPIFVAVVVPVMILYYLIQVFIKNKICYRF